MKIVKAPHPILSQKAIPVKKFNVALARLIGDMVVTLEAQTDPEGVGLAACQVGRPEALFIIKPEPDSKPKEFINARIIKSIQYSVVSNQGNKTSKSKSQNTKKLKYQKSKSTKLEGCLSIPSYWGNVVRSPKILVEYQDLKGEKHTEWFTGFPAIIIQHEVDHLSGILFTRRVLEQKNKLYLENDGKLEICEI